MTRYNQLDFVLILS